MHLLPVPLLQAEVHRRQRGCGTGHGDHALRAIPPVDIADDGGNVGGHLFKLRNEVVGRLRIGIAP